MKLLASIVLASIFMGTFVGLKTQLDQTSKYTQFKNESQELATIIKNLGGQDPQASKPKEINIPPKCAVKFEGENIKALVNGSPHIYPTGVKIYREYLFSIEENLDIITDNLDNENISRHLRDRYNEEGYTLSENENVSISVLENGKEWNLKDKNEGYNHQIKKEDGKLNIYPEEKLSSGIHNLNLLRTEKGVEVSE